MRYEHVQRFIERKNSLGLGALTRFCCKTLFLNSFVSRVLKGHSQRWDRADLNTEVHLNLKSKNI